MVIKIMNSVLLILLAVGLFYDFDIKIYVFAICCFTFQILVKLQEEECKQKIEL